MNLSQAWGPTYAKCLTCCQHGSSTTIPWTTKRERYCTQNLFLALINLPQTSCSAKANEKYTVLTPFNVIQKILGPYMFSATSRDTLNEKIELYFHDYSFVPLFIQVGASNPSVCHVLICTTGELSENEPIPRTRHGWAKESLEATEAHGKGVGVNIRRRPCRLSHPWVHFLALFLLSLVLMWLRSSEQHWTLMPTHAVLSTVRPSSFLYGPGSGYGGPNAMTFPQY